MSYCYAVRDQNRLVYQADEEFVAGLPGELRGPMQRWFDRFQMGLEGAMDMFKSFHSLHQTKRRVKIQLAPANVHLLRMATVGGAKTTPYGSSIGTLEVRKAADMVQLDWDSIAYPYLDEETPLLDAAIYQNGRFTKVDQVLALKALHDDLNKALADDEVERRKLSKALLPHARKFYADYIDPSKHVPFYKPSSRI